MTLRVGSIYDCENALRNGEGVELAEQQLKCVLGSVEQGHAGKGHIVRSGFDQ